jgi:hypothetical protein
MPLSISGLLLSRDTDIDQRALEYINLFIKYFNIVLKRTKLTSHTNTKLMDMSDRYRLRDNSPDMETPTTLSSLDADFF